jgi:voltage-gated potassium channel
MSSGSGLQAQDDPTAKTHAALRAERIAQRLEVPLIVAALLAIPTIIVQESNFGGSWQVLASILDWSIWGVFVANLVIMLAVVPDRKRWLIANPMDVLIVVLTPPFLPAAMKLARVLPIVRLFWLVVVTHRLRKVLSFQGLRFAALIVFTIVVGGGVLFVAVEPGQNLSTWDGLWWATETVTTVAYGDIYPTTPLGRIVATVVMTAGIGFVALLTGALAQRFLYGVNGSTDPDQAELLKKIDDLSHQVSELREALKQQG